MVDPSAVKPAPLRQTWHRLMQVAGDGAPALKSAIIRLGLAAVLHGLCLAVLVPVLIALLASDLRGAGIWLGVMAGLFATSAILRWQAYNFEFHGGMIRITQELRTEIGEKLRRIPLEAIAQQNSGAVAHKLLTGVDNTMTTLLGVANAILLAILPPLAVGLAMLVFDWWLGLLTLAMFPLIIVFYYRRRPAFGRSAQVVDDAHRQLHERVLDYTQGLPVLRASGARLDDHPLSEEIARLEALQTADTNLSSSSTLFMSLAVQSGLLIAIAAGAALFATGGTGWAVFLSFLVILPRFGEPLSNLVLYTYMFNMLETALGNIESLRAIPDQTALAPEAVPDRFDVTFEDVVFTYQGADSPALRGLSAQFTANRLSAIVGPSGQGKTTIFRLLQRFADPQQGRVLIGGIDIRRIPPAHLASLVSVVFQDVHLFTGTMLSNIRIARPSASETEVIAAAQMAGCDEFIRALPEGYDTRLGEGGATLSGGERQRISIARAFLKDSPIILMDEPTAALDTRNERLVQMSVSRLVQGRTVIVVSHRMSLISGADRIFVVEAGMISEAGRHDALMAQGARYFRMQSASQEEEVGHG